MVVNPLCEQLLLEQDSTAQWRNATLGEFAELGCVPATGDFLTWLMRWTRVTAVLDQQMHGGANWPGVAVQDNSEPAWRPSCS